MASFDDSTKYAAQEEGVFFDDGREIELLHYVYGLPADRLAKVRNSPEGVLDAIDEYGRKKKYLMNVGAAKGKIVRDLVAEVKPATMVELGGYIGYSAIAFAGEVKKHANGRSVKYYSLERNPEFAAVIMALADLAGLSDVLKVIVGPSTNSIQRLQTEYGVSHIDLMFLDHYKPLYVSDLKLCEKLGLISEGSVMAADNVIKPGNPPYLKYVRSSCKEKKEKLATNGTKATEEFADRTKNQYIQREGEENIEDVEGRWDLIYESKLINSFEPTGEPVSRMKLLILNRNFADRLKDGVEITRCVGVEKA